MFFGIVLFAMMAGTVASQMVENGAIKGINSLADIQPGSSIVSLADVADAAQEALLLDTALLRLHAASTQAGCDKLLFDSQVDAVVGPMPRLIESVNAYRTKDVNFMVVGSEFAQGKA